MRHRISYLMDEIWERAVETALDGQTDPLATRRLTLDGAVKCVQGRLPPPNLLERFQNLEHLSIANIGVSSLEQFPRLRNLQKLILSDNRIAGGLEFLVQAGLDSLSDLDLSNNRIQHIEDLVPLAQLRLVSLDLYECPVTRVKDYRSRVFGLIKSLKYLDKMDAEENERPESDDEEDDEEEEEEEDDPGSGEVDGEEGPYRMSNGRSDRSEGVLDVDEEEESDADEEETETGRGEGPFRMTNGGRERGEGVLDVDEEEESDADEEETETGRETSGGNNQSNGFRVEVLSRDNEEDGDNDEENESGEEIDEEEGEDDDVVEVHEIEDSDEEDGVEDEDEDDDDDDDEVDDDDGDFTEPENTGRPTSTEGEIDAHEQGEDDGESGEDEQGVEDAGDIEGDEIGEEEQDEDNDEGYLVQPVNQGEDQIAGVSDTDQGHEEDNGEEEEEVDDDDTEQQILPSSSSHLKRKRSDNGEEDNEFEDEDVVECSKSSKKSH